MTRETIQHNLTLDDCAVYRRGASSTSPAPGAASPRVANSGVNGGEAVFGRPGEAAVADLVSGDEIILLLLRPSILFVPLSSLGAVAGIVIVMMLGAYLTKIAWIPWADSHAFTLGALAIVLRLVWQTLEWWNRLYVLTDRRLIRRMGVIRVAVFEAPLSSIQHTSVFISMRERLFGLGSIGFATAGSDTYDAFWSMIAKPYQAHKVVVEAIRRYGRGPGRSGV